MNPPSNKPGPIYEDRVYGCAGDVELIARIYYPGANSLQRGIVMLHGGAWTANDRTTPWVVCEDMASRGMTVCSLDFRCGPEFQHPSAVADIAAGIRWFRAQADRLEINPESIGLIGSSSGGHLALVAGILPNIPPHMTTKVCLGESVFVESSESAEVAYIVALWPVSDPQQRYQFAIRNNRKDLVQAQDAYFGSTKAMQRASVQEILRKKEFTHLPPIMVVQPGKDLNVPEDMTTDLLIALQACDADVSYVYMPGLPHAFAYNSSHDTDRLMGYVSKFVEGIFE